jgi:hypothetical protein
MAAASYTRLGRLSLTNGDHVAIEWIASEFAKAGAQACVQRQLPATRFR